MAGNFDPYYTWLGIPPEHQPPHHYRLLAIEPFESNPEVIANAADQRMALLRTFQTGKHAQLSQRLLNELAAVRLCLLSPEVKADYDARLRAQLVAADRPDMPVLVPSRDMTSSTRRRRANRSGWWMPVAAGALAAAAIVVLLVRTGRWPPALAGGSDAGPATVSPEQHPSEPSSLAAPAATHVPSDGDEEARSSAEAEADNHADLHEPGAGAISTRQDSPVQGAEPAVGSLADDVLSKLAAGTNPAEKKKPQGDAGRAEVGGSKKTAQAAVEQAQAPPAAPTEKSAGNETPRTQALTSKLPVPSAEAQKVALDQVEEIFEKDFAAAGTPELQSALAGRLLRSAAETKDNAAGRYVLLAKACDLAISAADGTVLTQAIAALADTYQVDALYMEATALHEASKQNLDAARGAPLLQQTLELIDRAVEQDRFDIALPLEKVALAFARKVRGRELFEAIDARMEAARAVEKEYRQATAAAQKLKEEPDDPAANLAYGRYLALVKGNWEAGLPLLTKGSDRQIAAAARLDLARLTDPRDQVQVADAWYELVTPNAGLPGHRVPQRALYWYRLALRGVEGLDRAKCQKRVEELSATAPVASDGKVLATDQHIGHAGTKHERNIYMLKAAQRVNLNRTQVHFRARSDRSYDSKGDILLSVDGVQWTKIGVWTPASLQRAKANDYWQTVSLEGADKKIRTDEVQVRFQYHAGNERLDIYEASWMLR